MAKDPIIVGEDFVKLNRKTFWDVAHEELVRLADLEAERDHLQALYDQAQTSLKVQLEDVTLRIQRLKSL